MILPYLNFETVFSYKTSFLDLYSLQNFETIISCRKLTSPFSLSHATNCHALDFTWRRVWPWRGKCTGNRKKEKKNKKKLIKASKKQTKTKQWVLSKPVDPRTDYLQLPLISPWLIQLCKGSWVGLYPGGLISFEMSHSSVDRNTFLIYQFLINLWNVIINRIHFNFNNKIETVTART